MTRPAADQVVASTQTGQPIAHAAATPFRTALTLSQHLPAIVVSGPANTPGRSGHDVRQPPGGRHETHDDHDHDDHGGLHRDLRATGAVIDRRRLLRMAAGFGARRRHAAAGRLQRRQPDLAERHDHGTGTTTPPTTTTPRQQSGACSRIPEETAGPYPGDGSNGPTVLSASGVVRSDIRSSFAGLSGTAARRAAERSC